MPELPDVVVYLEALDRHVAGKRLERVTLFSPFVLRSVDPPIDAITGQTVQATRRIGKRIVLAFADDVFLVLHLMIAGRLRWRAPDQKLGIGKKLILATFTFEHGTLLFTEASSKKRASMQLVRGDAALHALDPGGIEPLDATREQFHDALTRENHTVKRSLTDPHLFSGIGNAYSDEILHAAKLSPLKQTRTLRDDEFERLYEATRATLLLWVERLRAETGGGFPEKGHRLSGSDGGPRAVQAAVPGLRIAGAADRLRRERVQLLRDLPDRRPVAGGSLVVAIVERRLAEIHRRTVGRVLVDPARPSLYTTHRYM
jgi:formamidopyrimidine-DNA glycosylase